MNWTNIENGWTEYKASAKQQWNKLSDPQLNQTLGRRELLSSTVQDAYALSEEETERQDEDRHDDQHEHVASEHVGAADGPPVGERQRERAGNGASGEKA